MQGVITRLQREVLLPISQLLFPVQARADTGRYREIQGDIGRFREVQGDISQLRLPLPGAGRLHGRPRYLVIAPMLPSDHPYQARGGFTGDHVT